MHNGVLRVARGIENGQVWQQQLGLTRQLRTAQGTGHDHIGKQHVDRHTAFHHVQGGRPVVGAEHPVAELPERVHDGGLHRQVVLHYQNRFAAPQCFGGAAWWERGR